MPAQDKVELVQCYLSDTEVLPVMPFPSQLASVEAASARASSDASDSPSHVTLQPKQSMPATWNQANGRGHSLEIQTRASDPAPQTKSTTKGNLNLLTNFDEIVRVESWTQRRER